MHYTDGAQILADEEALCIVEETRILRVPKDGTTAFAVVVPRIPIPSEIAIDEENVYWAESQQRGHSFLPEVGVCL